LFASYTQNETGLAVVLGHEVAHALADPTIASVSSTRIALACNMRGLPLQARI